MPTKSPQIKTSDLGRGRGGRPCAGQQAPGPTRLVTAAVPERDRQRIKKLSQALVISESELIRRAISEYLLKMEAQESNLS
jgi:hypothetical protein